MTDKPTSKVRPFLRVVANGITADNELRATLIATPEPSEGQDSFEISAWPSTLARRLFEGKFAGTKKAKFGVALRLRLVDMTSSTPLKDQAWYTAEAMAVGHKRADGESAWHEVDSIWQQALMPDKKSHWQALVSDIRRSLRGKKHETDPNLPEYKPPATPKNFDTDGALLARRPVAIDRTVVKGILPIKQADYAVDEERVRAARVIAKMHCGPYSCPEDPDIDLTERPDPAATTDSFPDARRRKLYKEFTDTVTAPETTRERKKSKDTFTSIASIITGAGGNCPACTADTDVIPVADNVCGVVPPKQRATHTYGTWLQRKTEYKAETITSANTNTDPGEVNQLQHAEGADVELDRVRSVYYALQGDPLLSRLFCLAVDMTFELPAQLLTALKSNPQLTLYLHLDLDPTAEPSGETDRLTPRVMTAAKLLGAAAGDPPKAPKLEAFWPVSRFEAGVTSDKPEEAKPVRDDSLVEQKSGVWILGTGYSESPEKHAPQYDLVSLDIRRAVDSKPDGVDRGQRHSTAGFSVLDRGRARQIARDLAISATQSKEIEATKNGSRGTVILYAEELTVGRRVDVAAVKPGTPTDKPIEWRSLMNRFVTFKKMNLKVEQKLRLLLNSSGSASLLDESAFQVAARFMPMVEGSDPQEPQAGNGPEDTVARSHEAIIEEAIFLWDGTPAAVATSTGAGDPKTEGKLPFVRAFDLPRPTQGGHLRPAPLRYGVPYLFGFRSMFLGGGSPSMAEVRKQRSRAPGSMLPPPVERPMDVAEKTPAQKRSVTAPRRFLRHEGISAPQLLLPVHLAQEKYGPMGYEQADQAIVRSGITLPAPASSLTTTPMGDADSSCNPSYPAPAIAPVTGDEVPERGPPVIGLADRVRPRETMRILVAPEASMQMVVRHGCLDKNNSAKVLFGGLLDVVYDPAKKQKADDKVAAGFPTVVTRRAQSLEPDGAIYVRDWGAGGKGGEAGIPVFKPGPHRAPKNAGSPSVGYLPDPAAEEMSIRARIRGTDRYLAGDIAVDLYAPEHDVHYPNALPVVIRLTRRAGSRKEPATKITDIANKPTLTTFEDKKGGFSARVREVIVALYEGEDFELEIVCLPKKREFACSFSLPETIALQLIRAASDKAACSKLECLTGPVDLSCYKGHQQRVPLTGLAGHVLPDIAPIAQAAEDILATVKNRWPIEEVAAVTRLRVCHAVNAPPEATRFVTDTVKVKRPADPQKWETEPDAPGTKSLILTGRIEIDLEHVDAFEIVATTLAANGKRVDEPSRSRSVIARRSGRWPKLTPRGGGRQYIAPRNVVGFDVANDGRVQFPNERVTLLRVDNLPPRAREESGNKLFGKTNGRLTAINLGMLHAAAISGGNLTIPIENDVSATPPATPNKRTRTIRVAQPSVIADTMARGLKLEIVALSRFAETFETAPAYTDHGEPLLHRRQPLRASDQSRVGPALSVASPATERPPAPEVRRPEPSFVFRRSSEKVGDIATKYDESTVEHTVMRTALCRIPLGRGWNAGERLGIVLWPNQYFGGGVIDADRDEVRVGGRAMILSSFEDRDVGPGGAFVTRWGGDPIREDATPQVGMFIPPAAFEDWKPTCPAPGGPRLVDDVLMPLPADSDQQAASGSGPPRQSGEIRTLAVSLLTYEPRFDLDREEWYVDVHLAPRSASEPFVRFGLVRYQANSLVDRKTRLDLRASNPVTAWAQVMPDRTLTVKSKKAYSGQCDLSVVLEGFGSIGIKDMKVAETFPEFPSERRRTIEQLAMPAMRVAVVHEAWRGDGSVSRTPIVPGPNPYATAQPEGRAKLKWSYECALPPRRFDELGPGSIVVYVEEFDRRMPASYEVEPIRPADMFDLKNFRESGPRFSARVALHNFVSRRS